MLWVGGGRRQRKRRGVREEAGQRGLAGTRQVHACREGGGRRTGDRQQERAVRLCTSVCVRWKGAAPACVVARDSIHIYTSPSRAEAASPGAQQAPTTAQQQRQATAVPRRLTPLPPAPHPPHLVRCDLQRRQEGLWVVAVQRVVGQGQQLPHKAQHRRAAWLGLGAAGPGGQGARGGGGGSCRVDAGAERAWCVHVADATLEELRRRQAGRRGGGSWAMGMGGPGGCWVGDRGSISVGLALEHWAARPPCSLSGAQPNDPSHARRLCAAHQPKRLTTPNPPTHLPGAQVVRLALDQRSQPLSRQRVCRRAAPSTHARTQGGVHACRVAEGPARAGQGRRHEGADEARAGTRTHARIPARTHTRTHTYTTTQQAVLQPAPPHAPSAGHLLERRRERVVVVVVAG